MQERRDAGWRDAGRRESGLEGIRNGGIWDWRYTRNEGYIRGFRTREMLDRRNTGQLVCRKGGYSTGGTGQEGCRMRGMQDRWDARSGGMQHRTGRMLNRWDVGQVVCRTGVIRDRYHIGKV